MLAGVLPFRGDSMSELMFKIANEEAADIRIIRPELSENLANVVALALSKRPETRYQTGDQFAADLRAVEAQLAGQPAAKSASAGVQQSAGMEKTVSFASTTPGVLAGSAPKDEATDIEI
jgi:serine/threonine-protein kinase